MAASPEDFLFALAGSLVMVALAAGLTRRASGLGRAEADFMAAFLLTSVALAGAVVAVAREWDGASDVLVAATAAASLVSVAGACLYAAGVRARGLFGDTGLRWALLTAAIATAAFGWGAVAAGGTSAPAGAPSRWVTAAVGAAAAGAVGAGTLSTMRARASLVVRTQLSAGAGAMAAGLVVVALGTVSAGSAIVMVGGAFVYSAARGGKRDGSLPAPQTRRGDGRGRRDAGVKVRVPKGGHSPVTRFRDDGLPPGGNP